MKREADNVVEDPSLKSRKVVPDDLEVAVPLPRMPRLWSIDKEGHEVHVAELTPVDVISGVNKRIFMEKQWGKNVFKDNETQVDPLERLPEDMQEIVKLIAFARVEIEQLQYFAGMLAEGEVLQMDHVAPLPPLEEDEMLGRAGRLHARKQSLSRAAAKFRAASAQIMAQQPQDKVYFSEVSNLRKIWPLQIIGGSKFSAVLTTMYASSYSDRQDWRVSFARGPDGRIELRVPQQVRKKLCVNDATAFGSPVPEVARGDAEVHRLLMDIQRAARSTLFYTLLSSSSATSASSFAQVRQEGTSIKADLAVSGIDTDVLKITTAAPPVQQQVVTDVEVFCAHFLAAMLHQVKTSQSFLFGEPIEFVEKMSRELLGWLLLWRGHRRFRHDVNEALLGLCRRHRGICVVWGGSDMSSDMTKIVSNAYFYYQTRPVLSISLVNVGTFQINGVSRSWTTQEACAAIEATLTTSAYHI